MLAIREPTGCAVLRCGQGGDGPRSGASFDACERVLSSTEHRAPSRLQTDSVGFERGPQVTHPRGTMNFVMHWRRMLTFAAVAILVSAPVFIAPPDASAQTVSSGEIGYACDSLGCAIGSDGSHPHVILGGGSGTLSPDGTQQVFVGQAGSVGPFPLSVGNSNGSGLRAIWTPPGIPLGNPSWNPQGSELAVELQVEQSASQLVIQLWVLGSDGGAPRMLVSMPTYPGSGSVGPTAWSPDGQTVAFAQATANGQDLSTVAAVGGPTAILSTLVGSSLVSLSWSPDSTTLLSVLSTGEVNGAMPASQTSVVTFPSAGGPPSTLLAATPLQDNYSTAYYSPDGHSVVVGMPSGLAIAGANGSGLHLFLPNAGAPTGWSLQPADLLDSLAAGSPGYDLVAGDGGIFSFHTTFDGSLGGVKLNAPTIGGAATKDGRGYWLAARDGGVFAFGDAPFKGSAVGRITAPVVGIAAAGFGGGYYLVSSDGNVYGFGAYVPGTLIGTHLAAPIVDMATSPGGGYWLVGADGGVFAFDAPFRGSAGGLTLNQPVMGMAVDVATGGYWLVAADGGVFGYDAPFYGSTGGLTLNKPVVQMSFDPITGGYWLVAADGGVFAYDAPFYGSTGGQVLNRPVVAVIAPFDQGLSSFP